MNSLILTFGKVFSQIIKLLNLGNGSTWPGHIALTLNPNFVNQILKQSQTKIILVTGTNGKTTTAKLLQTIFEKNGRNVFLNSSGANLLNGIASSIILNTNSKGNLLFDYAIFEVDENTLSQITEKIEPDFIIALNLFRDQLDRYGEINTVAKNWKKAYQTLSKTEFVLNADDPQIAYLGEDLNSKAHYFGLNDKRFEYKTQQHAADSITCPKCGTKLAYDVFYFSHLGKWQCLNCKLQRPNLNLDKFEYYPLVGTYAIYDTLAAVLIAQLLGFANTKIVNALKTFKPAFGRQEIIKIKDKKVQLFLAKNPTSFNESLRTIKELNGKNIIIVLNDKIPDGLDVSWIWDIDFESILNKDMNILLMGERKFDMALRLKYANYFVHIAETMEEGINSMLKNLNTEETLYILPNYSAMLETRKILTGKKIL